MIKWALQTLLGLAIVFAIAYLAIWALWQWLWLSIPVFIICYLLFGKSGIISRGYGRKIINLK